MHVLNVCTYLCTQRYQKLEFCPNVHGYLKLRLSTRMDIKKYLDLSVQCLCVIVNCVVIRTFYNFYDNKSVGMHNN